MKAEVPINEVERLAALYSYDVVDSEREESFDDLTRLAAFICGAPIAAISLAEDTREWFKASLGAEIHETPIESAFSAHAILEPHKPLIVQDASLDPRFMHNRLVVGPPGVRFYAGVPLVDASGFALGTISVIDVQPREISAEQVEMLRILARQTISQIQLRKARASLRRQTKALEKVREDALRSVRGQANLLRSASLDLQATIQWVLKSLYEANEPDEARRLLDSANCILSLIGDVVDLEVGRQVRPTATTDVAALLRDIATELKREIEIRSESSILVPVDGFAISTLFRCLVNALPARAKAEADLNVIPGSPLPSLRVALRAAAETPDLAVEPFGYQASRRIVELLDGKFETESALDHVLIHVEVPIRATLNNPVPDSHSSSERRSGSRVLVAEDNQVNVMLLKAMLEERGYDVEHVENGRQAVEHVVAREYDVVLMDIQMPELDGLEATRLIRQQGDRFRDLPIIALTANATQEDREACLAAGMNDYISKPYKQVTLTETLQRWGLTRT